MKRSHTAKLLSLLLLASGGAANGAVWHEIKQPLNLHADASRPCAFFQLEGVGQSQPGGNAGQWFTIPRSHAAFSELWALLLTAKASKMTVDVRSLDTSACGHTEVDVILMR